MAKSRLNRYSFYEDYNELSGRFLYKFLRRNRLFEEWLENVIDQHKNCLGVPQYQEDGNIFELLKRCKNIDHSFNWGNTPQGHTFWSDIHRKEIDEWEKLKTDMERMGSLHI